MFMPNVLDSYPKGWQNPIIARASAALPAAGAWDASPTECVSAYAHRALILVTYTRGAVNGAVDVALQVSPYSGATLVPAGAQEWIEASVLSVGGVVAGADTRSREQMEYITFQAVGAAAETVQLGPIEIGGTVERIRIPARESGVVGTPGTCQITIELM